MTDGPLLEAKDVVKKFGSVIALSGVSLKVQAGEVHCLLGDNGAGKSTLIKTLSGVHRPTEGQLLVKGEPVAFASPRDALDHGIATVFQDLALISLMSVTRNFFLGREPVRPERFPVEIPGERQCIAIARAIYFGAEVLILDEPTSALGVTQTAMVLKCIDEVRSRGLGVVFITHNVRHAMAVGDRFTVLNRGRTTKSCGRDEVTLESLQELMAGGALPAAA